MPDPLVEVLRELRSIFERLGVRWYLFGAQAAILYGSPRLTADVDVSVDIAAQPPAPVIDALARAGFEVRIDNPVEFMERTRVLPLQHAASGIAVHKWSGSDHSKHGSTQRSGSDHSKHVTVQRNRSIL